MTDWMIHAPFEARFVLIGGAILAIAWGVAWLVRRPLGRFRENILVRLVTCMAGVWVAMRIATWTVDAAAWLAGLWPIALPVLILTPFAADLARRHAARKGATRRTLIAVTAGVFLFGFATLRLVADKPGADRAAENLMISRHLSGRLWSEPSWSRVYKVLDTQLTDQLDAALERNRAPLADALRARDKAQIDRATNALIDDLFGIEIRNMDAIRRAPAPH